jgi:uncharacterized phage-associated protein
VALKATSLVEKHDLALKDNVRTSNNWFNRILIPVYHPGQRAMLHRSFANQRSDYQFIADRFKQTVKGKRKVYGSTRSDVAQIVNTMLKLKPNISYFALHKLFYLIENRYVQQYNERLTSAYFVRQKDGPYCTELHPSKLKRALPDIDVKTLQGITTIIRKSQLTLFESNEFHSLSDEINMIIEAVMEKYGDYSNEALKRAVYLTAPMKHLLRLEKHNLINLYNAPIDFFQ